MPDDLPDDPISALGASVTQLHELFVSFQRAGFRRDESLCLVGQMLAATVLRGKTPQ